MYEIAYTSQEHNVIAIILMSQDTVLIKISLLIGQSSSSSAPGPPHQHHAPSAGVAKRPTPPPPTGHAL